MKREGGTVHMKTKIVKNSTFNREWRYSPPPPRHCMVSLHSDTGTSFSQVEAWSVLLVCRGLWGAANWQRQQKGLASVLIFILWRLRFHFRKKNWTLLFASLWQCTIQNKVKLLLHLFFGKLKIQCQNFRYEALTKKMFFSRFLSQPECFLPYNMQKT
jgi:hypothetical protein